MCSVVLCVSTFDSYGVFSISQLEDHRQISNFIMLASLRSGNLFSAAEMAKILTWQLTVFTRDVVA